MKTFLVLVAFIFAQLAFAGQTVSNKYQIKSQTIASVTASASQILAGNLDRQYLLIQNKGSAAIYLKYGATLTGTAGIAISPGGYYELTQPPTSSVWAISATGTVSVLVIEGQ